MDTEWYSYVSDTNNHVYKGWVILFLLMASGRPHGTDYHSGVSVTPGSTRGKTHDLFLIRGGGVHLCVGSLGVGDVQLLTTRKDPNFRLPK